jgi:hypothetical protein
MFSVLLPVGERKRAKMSELPQTLRGQPRWRIQISPAQKNRVRKPTQGWILHRKPCLRLNGKNRVNWIKSAQNSNRRGYSHSQILGNREIDGNSTIIGWDNCIIKVRSGQQKQHWWWSKSKELQVTQWSWTCWARGQWIDGTDVHQVITNI